MKYQFAAPGETFIANVLDASGAVVGQCVADSLPYGTFVKAHPDSENQGDTIIGVLPDEPVPEETQPGAKWPFPQSDESEVE